MLFYDAGIKTVSQGGCWFEGQRQSGVAACCTVLCTYRSSRFSLSSSSLLSCESESQPRHITIIYYHSSLNILANAKDFLQSVI